MSIKSKLFILCIGLLLMMYSSSGVTLIRPAFLYIGLFITIVMTILIFKKKK